MPTESICPLCGFDQITHQTRLEKVSNHFGGQKEILLAYDTCQRCGTDGDFANKNGALIREAIDSLKVESVKAILQYFSDNKVNLAGMERALELPQRTLAKWKRGSPPPSAAGVTLLRFLRLFPWLVDVANYNFDSEEGQQIHIKAAIDTLLNKINFKGNQKTENKLIPAIWVDSLCLETRQDGVSFLSFSTVLPERDMEQVRLMVGKDQLKVMIDLLCKNLNYYPPIKD